MNIKFIENNGDIVRFKVLEYVIGGDEDYLLFRGVKTDCCFYEEGKITTSDSLLDLDEIDILGLKFPATKQGYTDLLNQIKMNDKI